MSDQSQTLLSGVHLAASNGDRVRLEALLDADSAIVNEVENGLFALHRAVKGGHVRCVEILLARGATAVINNKVVVDGHSQCAIHMAVELTANALEMSAVLLSAGADVNATASDNDVGNESPLHLACKRGSKALIELLLQNGARITMAERYAIDSTLDAVFELPHNYAACADNVAALQALIDFERQYGIAREDDDACGIVITCAKRKCLPLMRVAFEAYGAAVKWLDGGDGALAAMIEVGDAEGFQYLLSSGCQSPYVRAGEVKRRALLNALCLPGAHGFLPFLLPFATPGVVAVINGGFHDDYPAVSSPVLLSLSSDQLSSLETALTIGFTANPVKIHITNADFHDLPMNRLWFPIFIHFNVMYSRHSTLSYWLIRRCSSIDQHFLKDSVALLLSHGSNANARDGEIPPLVALMVREENALTPGTVAWSICEKLIAKGVDWGHRSSDSCYRSPDLVLFAALTANTFILRRVILNSALDPVELLSDLNDVNFHIYRGWYPRMRAGITKPAYTRSCRTVRKSLGVSILDFLAARRNVSDTSAMIDLCEKIDEKYKFVQSRGGEEAVAIHGEMSDGDDVEVAIAAAMAGFLGAPVTDQETIADEYADPEADAIWAEIHKRVPQISALQHMCRIVLLNRLQHTERNGFVGGEEERSVTDKIDLLRLPAVLNDYLRFLK